MKRKNTTSFKNTLYLLVCVCFISLTQTSCVTQIYSPSATLSMTGTTAYCQGAAASANTLTYDQCTSGTGILPAGVTYTAQWYMNTTGATTIPGSTPHGGPIGGTSPAGGSGTINYTPSTATAGTFYYFCYVTWGATGTTCIPDYTSNAQMITVTAAPAAITGTASVCQGQTTTLATTSTGGAWSSSAPAIASVAGGVVTGNTPGTASIMYTIGGCAATRIVTVNAGPSAITPATAVTICQGATTAFSSPTPGGAWTSSNTGVATVNTSGTVTGTGGGTATITYTNGTTGCYVTKNITVNPVPSAITGAAQLCPGTTIPLGSATPGGTWSSSAPAVGTVNATTGVVGGITPGTTTITYSGCGFVVKEVTVNPLPAPVTGTFTVCETSGTTTLSSTTTGGTWSSSSPTNATVASAGPGDGIVTGVNDGTATITYTSALSCITTAVVTVNPGPDPILGVIPICAGQSMTLTNAIPGGTWSSAAPAIAIVSSGGYVTGVSGGNTTIMYTNACGMKSVNITVNPLPAPIEGFDTICLGSTTTFADATIGGTWMSDAPVVASVLTTSGLITGNLPGMANITYTMPGGCYTTKPVQVVPLPAAIAGVMQACPGTTTTLINVISGGMWSSGSPSIATINSATGVVTGVTAGIANITYTSGPGCAVYADVLINPLPAPIVGADIIYCAADRDTLYNPTPGGTWSSLTPSVATIDAGTGIVTVTNGGTAVIKYTLPTGCAVTKTMSVNVAPSPSVTYHISNNTFYTETTWRNYQWYNGIQGAIPGATTYRTAALYYTTYWVRVSDDNECYASSTPFDYNETSSTTDPALNRDNYFVFPNPGSSSVSIEAPVNVRAVVTTVDGKVLITKENAKKIDITQLANGLYMIMLYDDNGIQRSVHKLIKQ